MPSLKLLLAEDVPDDARLLVHQLQKAGYEVDWERVDTEAGFVAALAGAPDIILSDYSMPQFSGLRALELLRDSGLDIPLILVSGTVGEEIAVQAMRHGAADYLLKDRTVRLVSSVERALRERRLQSERRVVDAALRRSESWLRSIFQTTPECVKVVAEDGTLIEMNQAGLSMLEIGSLGELQARPLLDFIAPDYRSDFKELHDRVLNGETARLEFEIVGLNGTRRYVETHASALRDAHGKAYAVLGITRDLTRRRFNELQIQKQLVELRRWRAATLGREDRILSLKREVNELLARSGEPPRYPSAETVVSGST